MPIIIKIQDIDEAIENLHYKNETTLKSRLLRAVRQYYTNDDSALSLQAIDTEELVKIIWETGDNRELIKTKRKNFSSLKSSVNSDLKKLYAEGKNPQGIVISHDNIFGISDEAKDKALTGIMDVFREKGIDTQSKISEILSALSDILSTTISTPDMEDTKEEIDRLKNVLGDISGKLGLSLQDIIRRAEAAGAGMQPPGGAAPATMPGRIKTTPGDIHDDLSMIDKGLQELAQEAAQAASDMESPPIKESLRAAFANIVEVLKDSGTDVSGKAKKIMAAVEGMLAETMEASAGELSGDQMEELKQIFHEMTEGAGIPPVAEDMPRTPAGQAGAQLISDVAAILADAEMNTGDKIGQIMSVVNNMIGEALAGTDAGLSDEDKAQIRKMMSNITGNIETLSQEELAGLEIIEEEVEDGADQAADTDAALDLVDTDIITEETETGALPADETVEITVSPEEVDLPPAGVDLPLEMVDEGDFEEVIDSAADTEAFAEELALSETAGADLLEEIAEADAYEAVEVTEEIAVPADETDEADAKLEITEDRPQRPEESAGLAEESPEGLLESVLIDEAEASADAFAEAVELADETEPGMEAEGELIEEILEAEALAQASEIDEESDVVVEEADAGALPEEILEVEESALEVVGETPDEAGPAQDEAAETEQEFADQEVVEEIDLPPDGVDLPPTAVDEEAGNGGSGVQVKPADETIDGDLREKTDLLTRLAEAAGALAAMGPDLNGSVYTEEEIRGKAKFLSEEFDRYLSIRDRFYNAHILIKGGEYLVGGAHLAKSVLPEQIVTLPDFYISKFPVTNALFEIFIEQTGYITTAEKFGFSLVYFPRMQRSRDPITRVERFSLHQRAYSQKVPGACWHRPFGPSSSLHLKRTHPVVHVSLEDAWAFASWTGKRLPTEIEWEAAARTARGNVYPWGNEWQDNACNIEASLHGDTAPVDQYIKFANAAEVADMLGNVLEWTSDIIGDRETSETYIVKGAGWISHDEISLTDRHYIEKSVSSNILGFRCVAI